MSDLIEPCPWCGSDGVLHRSAAMTPGGDPWAMGVGCERCGATGPRSYHGERAAVQDWNRVAALRAAREEMRERVADLEKAAKAMLNWIGEATETEAEMFERIGDWFYRETGMLRPGKDSPMGMNVDEGARRLRWVAWCEAHSHEVRAGMRAVLDAAAARAALKGEAP